MPSTDPIPIRIVDRPDEGHYVALVDDVSAGELQYRRGTGRILLLHTIVEPAFEGRGVGGALARHAIEAGRAAGVSIVVTCTFVAAWLERHPEMAEGVAVRV